jgi:dihydroorotate dehydrogenase
MRYLSSRLIEGLLEEMAVDSSPRMPGGAGVGKDAETTGTLVFAICGESTTGERELGAADPSQLLRRKYFPLLVHITPRGRPIITREILQVVDAGGSDAHWVDCTTAQPADKSVWKVPVGFIACASA